MFLANTTVERCERRETLRLTPRKLSLARVIGIIHIVVCIEVLG